MKIINYNQGFEEQVVSLWNKCCYFDPITVDKFRQQALFDDNFDESLCWVACENEKVVGFILAMKRKFPYLDRGLEPERGWINVMFVDSDYQNRGIGQALYDIAESSLKMLGVKNITLGAYSPSYFFAGLDPEHYPLAISFFEANGYQAGSLHYSMGTNLHGYQISDKTLEKKAKAESEGYRFVPFDYSYSLELLSFAKEEFGGGWKRNVLISMQQKIAEDRIILVIDADKKICGFCMNGIDGNVMRFGPIGIAEKYRNAGLGGILLELKLFDMCKKGIYRMYFITTDDPGKRYYERHGLSVIRTFVEYRKEI